MFYVYILESLKNGKFYIGSTSNLKDRVIRHKQGRSKFTKTILPVKLVYTEEYPDRKKALSREKELKSKKSHTLIAKMICG